MIQFQTCQERLKVATGGGMIVMSLSPDTNPGMCTEIMENGIPVSIYSQYLIIIVRNFSFVTNTKLFPCFYCIVQEKVFNVIQTLKLLLFFLLLCFFKK